MTAPEIGFVLTKDGHRARLADLSDPADLAIAQLLLEWGKAEGAIPADRADLVGTEDAIFVEVGTPAGPNTVIGGVVYYQPDGHDLLWVDVLFVSAPYRRQDIAGTLLTYIAEDAHARGLSQVQFGTLSTNQPMQSVGAVCGFEPHALVMRKPIGRAQ